MQDTDHMKTPDNYIKASVRAMAGYVPGEQPDSPDVIKLNTNENPYPPAPGVQAVLQNFASETLRRYPNPSCDGLRRQIAELHGVHTDNVIIGNGSDEILALCTRAFVEDDQKIGFFDPSYSLYPVLSEIRDVRTVPSPLGHRFEWQDPDTEGCAMFMLANPNAPSGLSVSCEHVRGFVTSFDGVVIVDEAYAGFADEDCIALARDCDNVLVVRTLSKTHSLAGIRLGYAVGHADLIGALMTIKDSYNVNALTQAVAEASLADGAYLQRTVEQVKATRARLAAALENMAFDVIPSQANFLFARPTHMPAKALFDALKARNIFVRYFSGADVNAYVRISIGTDSEIDALLAALQAIDSE